MPDWSIKIIPNPAAVAGQPGVFQPQQANQDDNVSWNNTTTDSHWPWPTKSDYTPYTPQELKNNPKLYLSDEIPPGTSSDAYSVPLPANFDPKTNTGTLYYRCSKHPAEHGTITVKGVKTVPPAPPPQD